MQARFEVENLAKRVEDYQPPEDFLPASEGTAADLPLLQEAELAAQIPDDAAAATEHSEETTNLRTAKDLAQRWQGVLDETLCRAGD